MPMVSCKKLRTNNVYQFVPGFRLLIISDRPRYLTSLLSPFFTVNWIQKRLSVHFCAWYYDNCLLHWPQCLRNEIIVVRRLLAIKHPVRLPSTLRIHQWGQMSFNLFILLWTQRLTYSSPHVSERQGQCSNSVPETGLKFPATEPLQSDVMETQSQES